MEKRLIAAALGGAMAALLFAIVASLITATVVTGDEQSLFSLLDDIASQALTKSLVMLIFGYTTIASASVLGGYTAARIEARAPILSGALSTWLFVLQACVHLYGTTRSGFADPLLPKIAFIMLMPVFGAFGGYILQHRRR